MKCVACLEGNETEEGSLVSEHTVLSQTLLAEGKKAKEPHLICVTSKCSVGLPRGWHGPLLPPSPSVFLLVLDQILFNIVFYSQLLFTWHSEDIILVLFIRISLGFLKYFVCVSSSSFLISSHHNLQLWVRGYLYSRPPLASVRCLLFSVLLMGSRKAVWTQ